MSRGPGSFIRRKDDPLAELGAQDLVLDLEVLYLLNQLSIDHVSQHDEKGMEQSVHST